MSAPLKVPIWRPALQRRRYHLPVRILITGGMGFIGSNLILWLLEQRADIEIVNLDALSYAGNPLNLASVQGDPRLRFVRGDVADVELVGALFAEAPFDSGCTPPLQ
jgi:dTDP-glucose 4,6-dehydratase